MKKVLPFLILGITAILCSRVLFAFFNDPEGPNLLVITGLAAVVYALSLAAYFFNHSTSSLKKFSLGIFVQALLVTVLYFLLT
jgi:hypothetical protein